MGHTAEFIAQHYNISREEMDEVALRSHNNAERATIEGDFKEDFELIELNEAFASQYLGCERELELNRDITNVNGSAIGLGLPVGATGCRIMVICSAP